jgi:hypothetical protein
VLLAKVAPAQEEADAPAEPEEEEEAPARRRSAEPREESRVAAVLGSSVFRSFARSAASAAGREITRSLFGTAPRRRRSSTRRRRR